MTKRLILRIETRRYLKAGVDKTAQAVATTLGVNGRNVTLDQETGSPTIDN